MADIRQQIDEIITKLTELKGSLPVETPEPKPVAVVEPVVSNVFQELRNLLNTDKWPMAVNPHLICDPNSETAKSERARGILELMVEENLEGLNFLDFGCGEGDCAIQAISYKAKQSVGYDIATSPRWKTEGNLLMTQKFEDVVSHGPYDAILVFDVLDHLVNDDPIYVLTKLKTLLSKNGRIYVRYHPFISRHALHHYHTLNKAFIHLVFTEAELAEIMPTFKFVMPGQRVVKPVMTYSDWATRAGLFVLGQRNQTEKTEPFFKTPLVANRILENTGFNSFPEFQLSVQFCDYTLRAR